jgi:hypothetical protein
MSEPTPLRPAATRNALLCVLALLTLVVYWSCLDHSFVNYDDPDYVTQNPHVQAGLTLRGVRWACTSRDCANWHPLTWLSLELDATLFGGQNARGFHCINVLLHTVNTVMLFWVLSAMTGAVWRSAVVAALFALHPLHVESVAWVAERKDVLSTLFWMLTLAAYLAYVRRPRVGRYLLVMLTLGSELMAKPMLVTLPFVLLLLDYWPLRRSDSVRQLVLEKVPLFALVLASCALTFLVQRRSQAVASLERFPLDVRVGNALLAYATYLGKTFWPLHLAVFYPHPGATISIVSVLAAASLLLVITVLVLGPGRHWPYLAVGWLWYLGTLVPVIGLVQVGNQAMADRYTYVPLIGVFLALTWGASDLARAWHMPRFVLAAGTVAVLAACVILTRTQEAYWKDDLSLYPHTIAVTQRNVLAHYNLGKALKDLGRPAEAETEYRTAIELAPTDAKIHNNLGNVLTDLGRREEALTEFRQAIALDFETALPHLNLGRALLEEGRFAEALASLQRGHELGSRDPHWPYPSAEWVREAEWFVEWDRKLPAVSVQMATILGRG